MMRNLLAILIFLISTHSVVAQFTKLKSTVLSTPATAAIDRAGEVYTISATSTVQKIDSDGNILAFATLAAAPTLFDPRDGSHVFVYYRKDRRYEFLLPDLQSTGIKTIDSSFAISPVLACPSGDHDLLVLDSADWSLKKINLSTNIVLYETIIFDSLTRASDIKFMREYQNFVFVLHAQKGIMIFNRMGRLLKTLAGPGVTYFNFLGEEVYYPEKENLHFFDLFSGEERKLTMPAAFEFAFLTDERLFLLKKNVLDVYSSKGK